MSIQLARPIEDYFAISNGADNVQVSDCFAEHAVVHDEGGIYEGIRAIEDWVADTRAKYQFHAEPVSHEAQGGGEKVTAEVSGNFPGSPIQISYVFELSDERIRRLTIS